MRSMPLESYPILQTPFRGFLWRSIDEQVRVHFDKDIGRNPKYPEYCMVLAWCWRRDREKVVTALEKLPSKMLVCGHNDYPATCKVALGEILEKAEVDPE